MKPQVKNERGHPMKPVNLKLISTIFSLFIILSVPSFSLVEEHPQEHGQHEDHEGHEDHEEPEFKFSAAELQELSIELAQAQAGVIHKTLNLTGEVIVAP